MVAFFVWRYAATSASTLALRAAAFALAAIGSVQTYAWIIANHSAGG